MLIVVTLFVYIYMCVCVCVFMLLYCEASVYIQYYSSSLYPISLTAEGTADKGGIAGIREHRRID